LILGLKNRLVEQGKNLPVLTVKIEQDRQVYLARVKRLKVVLIDFALTALKKVVMPVNLVLKALVLEIQIPTLLAVFDVGSSKNNRN
jgi:hypothetical protein